MKSVAPNFFIVGAPKCGTSSLANYLSEHPGVSFSASKEPRFWATDFPKLRKFNNAEPMDQYLWIFDHSDRLAVGEGSSNDLCSEVAISEVPRFNLSAKFIARSSSSMILWRMSAVVIATSSHFRGFPITVAPSFRSFMNRRSRDSA